MSQQAFHVDIMKKTAQRLIEHGPAFTVRRAIWRLHYERFQQLRKNRVRRPRYDPAVIRFLDNDFELPSSIAGLGEDLVLFGVHEPVATQLYPENLSPGDHVLDIGSNIGYWLLIAERAIGESGCILGFEPAPESYSILQRNVARSGHKNIHLLPYAVGATNETAQFYQSEVPNWGSLIQQDSLKQTRTIDVQVRNLEGILSEFRDFHPNALRMDLEGAELMVLESAREMLAQHKPCLFVEFHPAVLGWPAIRRTLVWLQDLGYSSGTLIQRTWDQPWISKWMRKQRSWSGPIETLIQRIESPKDPIANYTFSLILQGSRKRGQANSLIGSEK